MRKSVPWLLSGLVIAQGMVLAAQGQPAPVPPSAPALDTEVADLNRSIQELAALLREYVKGQQTELLLKRVEISLQKAGPLEQERRDLRGRRSADEEELRRLQAALAAHEAIEPQDPAKPEDPNEAAQKVLVQANVKRLKGRISQTDQRLAELDSALLEEERNVRHWEALIDQRLDQR